MKIRLWPAWLLILIAAGFVGTTPFLVPRTMLHFMAVIAGPILATLGILLWWLLFSRAKGARLLPVAAFVIPFAAIWFFLYREDLLYVLLYFGPFVVIVWVIFLTMRRETTRMAVVTVILAAWAVTLPVRIEGTDAEMRPELRWAWKPSAKELFERELTERRRLAALEHPVKLRSFIASYQVGDWPEFRSSNRDGIAAGRIRTDWDKNPPKPNWRQRVGAGWGSFAVLGDYAFTQEQRGEDEAVVCYDSDGHEVWEARVPGRFTEPIAKEGPRATPTVHLGKVYAFGATGKLVALDADNGQQIWLRDVCAEVGAKVPIWGFASSPLVIDGKVIIFAAAENKGTVAYNFDGSLAWANGRGTQGYSSPQRFRFDGMDYVLQVSNFGLEAFDPKTGADRGSFKWHLSEQNRVAQPTIINANSILIGTPVGAGHGSKRLAVSSDKGMLNFTETWESKAPRPYFNDGVVLDNHYYGWDDRNFVCVDLKNGKVKWNSGSGYGFGQVLLLPEQKLLLVQTERNGIVLLEANPDEQIEVAKMETLKDKTWNHPVVVRGKLYVRNGVEAACYDISEVEKK